MLTTLFFFLTLKVFSAKTTTADLKLAVTFQCIAAAYRQNKHKEAYNFLYSYHSMVKLAKNPAIFEVQELYSWSAIKRSERDYQESYRYVCYYGNMCLKPYGFLNYYLVITKATKTQLFTCFPVLTKA